MKHTLRCDESDLWHWTYKRGIFFFSGVSPSRRSAVRALLVARREARDAVRQMDKWLGGMACAT